MNEVGLQRYITKDNTVTPEYRPINGDVSRSFPQQNTRNGNKPCLLPEWQSVAFQDKNDVAFSPHVAGHILCTYQMLQSCNETKRKDF